jgi:hypothetical protein
MISDLDETIRDLLIKRGGINPAEVDISFDMPERQWSMTVSKPTVNVYLYDIHENLDLRNYEWSVARSNGSSTKARAPRRVDMAYLITVWTNDTVDQHRLLGHVLTVLFKYPELPEDLLAGSLRNLAWPIHAVAAQPDGVMRNTADFWSALDNNLKPSINYVITVPVDTEVSFTATEVKTQAFKFGDTSGGAAEDTLQISGVVRYKGKPDEKVEGVGVVAKELQMVASTDDAGNYAFRKITPGSHTFEVTAPGVGKRQVPVVVPSPNYDIEL